MKNLNKQDIEFLIDAIKSGKEIPLEYRYALFPTKQKEYELVYAGKMRKEDILADNEEAKAVPLQIEKVFNGKKYPLVAPDWRNLLVFGDNLQVLKTFYKNEDEIIKNKIKGKVKLIYIDPPFGTGDEYDGNKGQSAYSAKKKGADFVEFLRRRLIILREILADDGTIFVRIDYHFGHYVKLVMDEVFGKNNFRNELVINRFKRQLRNLNQFNHSTDSLFFYSKSENYFFNEIERQRLDVFSGEKAEPVWRGMSSPGLRNPPERVIFGKTLLPPKGRHWTFRQERVDELIKEKRIRINEKVQYTDIGGKKVRGLPEYLQSDTVPVDSNWTDIKGYVFNASYPTENPEELLERVIKSGSDEGDLVMDVFAGSGTTLAVAEKLDRRWIGCDIGKLSIYTIQKRLLEIQKSKEIDNPKKKYKKYAKSFAVVTSGLYDLGKVFALKKDEYIRFVKGLFEIEETKTNAIGGVDIDGKKKGFYAKIFPYWELEGASVDEKYLEELHKNLGSKIDGRFYIIAPANNVDFISDYHEIGGVKYYFLKVPYQIIKELHRVQFKKLRQPQSKKNINDLDEAIGFHFVRQPEVKSEIKKTKNKVTLCIKKFESAYSQDETGEKLKNFESLAMLLFDCDYDGEQFVMDDYTFAGDLTKKNEDTDEEVRAEISKKKNVDIEFPAEKCGEQIMVIYVDIYGNEFREVIKTK
ncbi:MAG: site-specific DNA-methyltransferase [Bdellovibrionales bacterium CG11_big_fil_rev_8_21_14_0_20_38_13]|nr:MAG: site-specific DNA-methyltransferase [Bdellovibrionales bacterium CG11_big_fil_rev_8_21_14_0_20_38_13]